MARLVQRGCVLGSGQGFGSILSFDYVIDVREGPDDLAELSSQIQADGHNLNFWHTIWIVLE